MAEYKGFDTLIIGSGPVGCAFARKLVKAGKKVLMIEAGAQLSQNYGEHLKNSFLYQRNVDLFASVIRGHLHPLSVSTRNDPMVTLDASSYRYDPEDYPGFILNNQNPEQRERDNLGAAATTYAVGGMATHWTCALPEFHPSLERSWDDGKTVHDYPINDTRMKTLYAESTALFNRKTSVFQGSTRHQLVKKILRDAGFPIEELPLSVESRADDSRMVKWGAANTVLGDLAKPGASENFKLLPDHQCTRLVLNAEKTKVEGVKVRNLRNLNETVSIPDIKRYIVACGAVLTPQLLHVSGLSEKLPALGRYLTEQPMAFCQVVLRQEYIDNLEKLLREVTGTDKEHAEKAAKRVEDYRKKQLEIVKRNQSKSVRDPADPLPIPKYELEPNLTIAASPTRPWHCQIHRDAFSYGAVPPSVDTRLIVDLRWFGMSRPRESNWVEFSKTVKDTFDMPQPTFHFQLDDQERQWAGEMMADMMRVASYLGGFMPGSEPQFLAPGLPLHIGGTTRMGTSKDTSVVNPESQVWGIENLWLGGNGLHPFGNAGNPTHTSVAMAIHAVEKMPKN
ncbi:pyranose oxidase [Streptomyces regalis]|uniref:Pyranose 2-oxidase n=1 Tax=Streptomyces regalis TaxID=68262 RepID=A0A0X3VDC1_9ACTN|nr:pyranose oxidase [Streptomyces regalis]KUL42769.1 pyranose oxidase [Streptomyces regalis]